MEEFKKGDYCIGENNVYYSKGEIEDIQPSMGSRSGLLYKIGDHWFFEDEIKPWYDGMVLKQIGANNWYEPNKTIKFIHNGTTYTIKEICYNSITEWCYLKVDKTNGTININGRDRGIGFYSLRPQQIQRIYKKIFD